MAGRPLTRLRNASERHISYRRIPSASVGSMADRHFLIDELVGDLSDIVEHLIRDAALLQRGFAGEALTLRKIAKLVATARDQLSEYYVEAGSLPDE